MEFESLYNNIRQYTSFPDEEYDQLIRLFKQKELKKNEHLLKSGDVCKHGIFVLDGCLSYFETGDEGSDKIIDLGTSGWWMADTESFFHGTISPFNIKAISASSVLTTDRDSFLHAIKHFPWFLYYHYFALLEYRRRTDLLLSNALHNQAEQKYNAMVLQRPEIFQLAPLHDIASFLGMTPQSLSRLRNALAHKKAKQY